MKNLAYYIDAFSHLNRAPGAVWTDATRKRAPHKPFLLLSLLDLMAGGILKSSYIDTQNDLNELNDLFVRYWRRIVPLAQKSSIAFPFSRLHNETFWKLMPRDKVAMTAAIVNNISTVSQLRSVAIGAKIDDDLYFHLDSSDSRNALRETLLAAHFSNGAAAVLRDQAAINAGAFDYSREIIETSHLPLVKEIVEHGQVRPEVRDQGFRRAVVTSYDHRCALCGIRILTPEGHTAVDAAHIEPWSESRNDDVRNGMALCKMCHWAFDEYMMSVSDEYTVILSKQISTIPNIPGFLLTLEGRGIIPPGDKALWPAQEYLGWHREKVLM
jgi:putative restriction endonuclease